MSKSALKIAFLIITFAVGLRVHAEPATLYATWSGDPINNASATAVITYDDAAFLLPNSGNFDLKTKPVSISVYVSNSLNNTSNSTVFHLADFQAILVNLTAPINLTSNWVGQAGLDEFAIVGSAFNTPSVVGSTGLGVLIPGVQVVEAMTLTSLRLVPSSLTPGSPVANLPNGLILSSMTTPALAPNGVEYFSGSIKSILKPSNLASGTSSCLLSWDPSSGALTALLRSGTFGYVTPHGELFSFKSFAYPVYTNGQLFFQCTLATGTFSNSDGTQSYADKNSAVTLMSNVPGSNVVTRLAQQSQLVPLPTGYYFKKFLWFHGVAGGAFIGAQTQDTSTPPHSGAGVYYCDGTTITPVVVAGQTITINGTAGYVVKSVGAPVVGAPAQADTRVGNADSVALIITTTTSGVTALKRFTVPQLVP